MIEKISIVSKIKNYEIDLKEYIELNSYELKKKYLDLVNDLSNIKINKKKLKDHYSYCNNHSLWEMSLIAEKNTLKSNKIFSVIKFIACLKIIKKFHNKKIILTLYDYDLQKSLKNLNKKNLIFINYIKKNEDYLYHLKTLIKITKFITVNFFLNKKKSNYSNFRNTDVLILSYFSHFKIKSKNFISITWSGISKIISKRISWVYIFFENKNFKKRNDLLKNKFYHIKNIEFIYDFLSAKILIKAFLSYFKYLFKYSFILKNILKVQNIYIKNLIQIQDSDFKESFYGYNLFLNLVWINLFDTFLSKISNKKIGLYLFENQNWEKAFVVSWKNNNHGKLVGYISTTINFWHLNYYHSPNSYRTNNQKFSPDLILSNSHINSLELKKFNYYNFKINEVESLRYNYLQHSQIKKKIILSNNNLVFLSGVIDEINQSFLDFFNSYQKVNIGSKLFVRPHPASNFFYRKDLIEKYNYQIVTSDVPGLANRFDKIICCSSTSIGIEFLSLGIDIMIFDSNISLDLSPYKGFDLFYLKRIEQIDQFRHSQSRTKKFRKFFFYGDNLKKWKSCLRII